MIDNRAARFLTSRQARVAGREALSEACARAWLTAVPVGSPGGRDIIVYSPGAKVSELAIIAAKHRADNDVGAHRLLETYGLVAPHPFPETEIDNAGLDRFPLDADPPAALSRQDTRVSVDHEDFTVAELVAAARSLAEPPNVDDLACALLLAKAIGEIEGGFSAVCRALNAPRPIIVIVCPVLGFATALQMLVENAEVLPKPFEFRPAPTGSRMSRRLAATRGDYRPVVVELRADEEHVPNKLSIAAAFETSLPVLLQVKSREEVPRRLMEAATLALDAGHLDGEVLVRLIELVRGARPGQSISDDLAAALDFTDLRMAVRPGLAADEIMATLIRYAEENCTEPVADERDDLRSHRSVMAGGSRAPRPSVFIEPSDDPGAPRVETLPGFDAAQAWAFDLKTDLHEWRAGCVRWSDLSTKMLLAGPPGVGKTTWVRALGNTLALPLLVTSAATWLSTGHLGEVLAAMNAAFADATRRAPCILFIDEADGLGNRERTSLRNDDFWTSFGNNALTLLDGAARTEGVVVVGATNRPSALDPALTRAGRLELTIEVTRPDVATLAEIFGHHLGGDLASVSEDYRLVHEVQG